MDHRHIQITPLVVSWDLFLDRLITFVMLAFPPHFTFSHFLHVKHAENIFFVCVCVTWEKSSTGEAGWVTQKGDIHIAATGVSAWV